MEPLLLYAAITTGKMILDSGIPNMVVEKLTTGIPGMLAGGIIGNRTDAAAMMVYDKFTHALKPNQQPVNHDLARALREAYLRATLIVCQIREQELRQSASYAEQLRQFVGLEESPELTWFKKLSQRLYRALRDLSQDNYTFPTSQTVTDISQKTELLLKPQAEIAQTRVEQLEISLHNILLDSVTGLLAESPPDSFKQMIQQGWPVSDIQGATHLEGHQTWFGLFCDFFVDSLKKSPHVKTVFEAQHLAELTGKFDQLLAKFDELLTQRQAILAPYLIQVNRRPLYEQFATLEMRQRVAKLMAEHLVLIGRVDSLNSLDRFITDCPGGILAIQAEAKLGKTATLSHWIASQHMGSCFVAYHLFDQRPTYKQTCSAIQAYRHLVGQLFTYFQIEEKTVPDNVVDLRDCFLGLLKNYPIQPNDPLVILLDGLEQAEDGFLSLPLPDPLPVGLFIIMSGQPGRWIVPHSPLEQHSLQPLPLPAIVEWLQQVGLTGLTKPHITQVIHTVTQGRPDKIALVVKELLQWQTKHRNLEQHLTTKLEHFKRHAHQLISTSDIDQRNPFTDKGDFFGRQKIVKRILRDLTNGQNVSLVGPHRVGKTRLMKHLESHSELRNRFSDIVYINMQMMERDEEFFAQLMKQLKRTGSISMLADDLARDNRQVLLMLDQFEMMGYEGFSHRIRNQLRGMSESSDSPLTLIIASCEPLGNLFLDNPSKASPLADICRERQLEAFTDDEAKQFIHSRLAGSGIQFKFTPDQIAQLLTDSQGNPGRLESLAYEIFDELTN